MIVSILQNVIRKILRRRPCQNFLPGVLCVTQGGKYTQFELSGKFMKVSYNDSLSDKSM